MPRVDLHVTVNPVHLPPPSPREVTYLEAQKKRQKSRLFVCVVSTMCSVHCVMRQLVETADYYHDHQYYII